MNKYFLLVGLAYCWAGWSHSSSDVSPISLDEDEPVVMEADSDSALANEPSGAQLWRITLKRYQNEIRTLQDDYGAYDPLLSENLAGLGVAQQALEQHEEAIDSFQRAIHIGRVNDGLFNMDGVPYLERLIESQGALGRWEEVHDSYQFMMRTYRHHFGTRDPALLPILEKMFQWHLNAYKSSVAGHPLDHLLSARDYLTRRTEIISQEFGPMDLRLVAPLHELSLIDYYLATTSPKDSGGFQFGTSSSKGLLEDPTEKSTGGLMINSYAEGKDALQRVVSLYENSDLKSDSQHGNALVHLGDWQLIFDKRQSAFATYERAYQLLANNAADRHKLSAAFGKPVALPVMPSSFDEASLNDASKPNEGYVLMSFNVAANGRVRQLELVEAVPENKTSMTSKVRRMLKATRFRPRFEEGKPVLTEGIRFRYVYKY